MPSVMRARIASLHRHPVKSGRVIDLASARVGRHGLEFDRCWLLVDAEDRFITQRTHSALARLEASPSDNGGLRLSHPAAGTLELPPPAALTAPGELREVRVWSRRVTARDCGARAAAFASAVVGAPARLVAAMADTFPDGYPLLVCNAASLADLAARLPAPIPMARFRPNLVVEGWEAWEEDRIAELCIGAVRLR
ncbi:MAG: MOSC domain-containing protein, partial [Gammaproteobacteria bacterium]|nr:MOSC domain-containing protein [Gammaproteobacteria bacterium]